MEHVARRMAGERHRPGADRLPGWRLRSDDRHSLPDQPAGRDLRSERQRAAHRRSVVRHLLLRAPRRARYRHAARATPAATPSAGLALPAPICRSSRTSTCGPATGFSCASRRSTCSTRLGSASRATRSERRISGASRARKMAGSSSSRRSTVSRRLDRDPGSGRARRSAWLGGRRSAVGGRRVGRPARTCESGLPQLTSREAKRVPRQERVRVGPTRIPSACGPSEARSRRARARGVGPHAH